MLTLETVFGLETNVPAYAVASGHPATPFKYRDIEHYKKLKSEGRYH